MFFQLSFIVSIVLGAVLLGESKYWQNPLLVLGALILINSSWRLSRKEGKSKRIILAAVAMSLIVGITATSVKAFNLKSVSLSTYFLGWYSGCLIFATILNLCSDNRQELRNISHLHWSTILAILIGISLLSFYQSLNDAPLVLLQPLYQFSGLLIPAWIGFRFFGEREGFSESEIILIKLGLLGAVCMILSQTQIF